MFNFNRCTEALLRMSSMTHCNPDKLLIDTLPPVCKKMTIYHSINTPHMGKSSIALSIRNDSLCSRIFRCESMNTYLYSVLL